WISIGESCCNGTGHDGTADGKIEINVVNNNIGNANFGIQQSPVAEPKFFEISNADFSTNIPAGFNHISGYKALSMASAALSAFYPTGGSLSATDPEDCANTSACNG